MADGNGKPYYWESMDINTTGENVGVVLDTLCNIVADNDLSALGKNTVKWIPGEEGKKGYFELGYSGEISASENQILVGNRNNWAEGNGLGYMVTPTKAYDSIAGMPDEGTIGVYSTDFPVAFGGLGAPSGNLDTTTYPYLKNGYISRDEAVQKIQGKSKIIIGEENTDYLASATVTHSPVLEMTGESELRLRDGASIRGTTVNNEIQFQFDNGINSISFTVAELTALKQLLSQPHLVQLTQQEYDELDPPDPNTVYVIGEEE